MNKDLNTALYEKMAAEQDKYRDWLKSQPPEEILRHTYEYTIREDILMAMEELELPDAQATALLASPSPLADTYREFEKRETGYMDVVRDSIESRAEAALDTQRELPVYRHSAAYAHEHGELDQYRTSQRTNIACKEAIEAAISENYRDNKAWAGTVEVPPNPDSFSGERNREFVVDSHPGLTDLFLTLAKQEYLLTQPLTPEDIQAEAGRLLRELQAQDAPNSPNGTHYMAKFSEDFMRRANSKDMDQVMAALPFRSMAFSGLNDRKGHFVLISKDEDRSKELRPPRRSVRRQLKQEPRSAGKSAEKKAPARKKKEPER